MGKNKLFKFVFVFAFIAFGFSTYAQTAPKPTAGANAGYNADGASTSGGTKSSGSSLQTSSGMPSGDAEKLRVDADAKTISLIEGLKKSKDQATAQIKIKRLESRMNALRKFENVLNNEDKSRNNIAVQLPKIESLGIDITEYQYRMDQIKSKLADARLKYAQISTILVSTPDEFSKAQKDQINLLLNQAHTLIMEAHQMLLDIVRELMQKVKDQRVCRIESFTANPDTVSEGMNTTLAWKTFGGASYQVTSKETKSGIAGIGFANPENKSQGTNTSQALYKTTDFTFQLNCKNNTTRTKTIRVEVPTAEISICDYAAPPTGCEYVPGGDYDPQTQCGMILECAGGVEPPPVSENKVLP